MCNVTSHLATLKCRRKKMSKRVSMLLMYLSLCWGQVANLFQEIKQSARILVTLYAVSYFAELTVSN